MGCNICVIKLYFHLCYIKEEIIILLIKSTNVCFQLVKYIILIKYKIKNGLPKSYYFYYDIFKYLNCYFSNGYTVDIYEK